MLEVLHLITTLAVGILAGALLTEGCILVPYWRQMEPSEFFRLHGQLGPSLFRYYAPLTTIAVVLAVASAVATPMTDNGSAKHFVAGGLCVAALLVFFVYFRQANAKFADHRLSESELPAELSRWAGWHWFRTLLVIAAFACSISASAV